MKLEQRSDRGEEVSHMVGGGARGFQAEGAGSLLVFEERQGGRGAAVIGGHAGGTGPGDVGP